MRPHARILPLLLALAAPACAGSPDGSAGPEFPFGGGPVEADPRPTLDIGAAEMPPPARDSDPRGLAPEGPDPVVAVVGGAEVRASDIARFLLRFDPGPALEALNQILDDRILEADAVEAGIVLPAGEVEARTEEQIRSRETEVRVQYGPQATLEQYLRERFGFTRETFRRDVEGLVRLQALRDRLVRYEAVREDSIRFRVLVTTDEEKAREAAARLRAGADFAALARQVSVAPPEELPPYRRGEIQPPALAGELFSMASGEVSRPVRIARDGKEYFQVFKVVEVRPAREAAYPEVAAEIEKGLRERPVGPAEYLQWARRARERHGVRILLEEPAAAPGKAPAGESR